MNKRILGMLLALAMVVPATPAIASHTNNYALNPVEHDDQGRSSEPDFAKTSVLGAFVENKVYDPTYLDAAGAIPDSQLGPPEPGHSPFLIPGCSDDSGRRPSGLCGLYTVGLSNGGTVVVPPKTVGVQGMTGNNAPGRYSATKATTFRFLDSLTPWHITPPAGGVQYIEYNRKLDDTGARVLLSSVDPNFNTDYLLIPVGIWSWYGGWADKNGNGVMDELGPTCTTQTQVSSCPPPNPDDEFWWYGNCFRFPSGPGIIRSDLCLQETTQMLLWVFPGNHHSFTGGTILGQGATASINPAEAPLRQIICAIDIFHGRKLSAVTVGLVGGQLPVNCPGRYEDLERTGSQFFGDPILDDQGLTTPDMVMADRSGDANLGTRQWVAGNGFTVWFYDQSVITSTVMVTAVYSPAACISPCDPRLNPVALANAQFADVDKYNSLSPALDLLLSSTLKPAARAQWVLVRDHLTAVDNVNDAILSNKAINRDPIVGPADDANVMAGFAREPNHPMDSGPATRGTCADAQATFNGWCNDYNAYATGRHAFLDHTRTRLGTTNFVFVVRNGGSGVGLSCYLCVAGGGIANPVQDGTPKPVGTPAYSVSLPPGGYLFGGNLGLWQDAAQTSRDTIFDLNCATYQNAPDETTTCTGLGGFVRTTDYGSAPDGWVGNIIDSTGYWRYRGYTSDTCTINGVQASYPYASCHPYRDGVMSNPQSYAAANAPAPPGTREWGGACASASFPGPPLTPLKNLVVIDIAPLDANGNPGTWQVPAFVDRNVFDQGPDVSNPNIWVSKLQDWTGKGTIRMISSCAATVGLTTGGFGFNDALILPMGNLRQNVRITVSAAPTVALGVVEPITDVDEYVGWGA